MNNFSSSEKEPSDEKYDVEVMLEEMRKDSSPVPSDDVVLVDAVELVESEEYEPVVAECEVGTESKELLPPLILFKTSLSLLYIDILLVARFPLFSATIVKIL